MCGGMSHLDLRQRKKTVEPVATKMKPTSESSVQRTLFEANAMRASSEPMQTAQACALAGSVTARRATDFLKSETLIG